MKRERERTNKRCFISSNAFCLSKLKKNPSTFKTEFTNFFNVPFNKMQDGNILKESVFLLVQLTIRANGAGSLPS